MTNPQKPKSLSPWTCLNPKSKGDMMSRCACTCPRCGRWLKLRPCPQRQLRQVSMTCTTSKKSCIVPLTDFAASAPAVGPQPKTLFWGMPLHLGDFPLTMGKVILTTNTQHMEAISGAGGNSWSLVTHMNEVSLGDTVRGEALSVGVNVRAT